LVPQRTLKKTNIPFEKLNVTKIPKEKVILMGLKHIGLLQRPWEMMGRKSYNYKVFLSSP